MRGEVCTLRLIDQPTKDGPRGQAQGPRPSRGHEKRERLPIGSTCEMKIAGCWIGGLGVVDPVARDFLGVHPLGPVAEANNLL
jgi:hypothetical protein